jgi:hypothetical protein
LLLKLIVTWEFAWTVIVLLSKAMFCATRLTVLEAAPEEAEVEGEEVAAALAEADGEADAAVEGLEVAAALADGEVVDAAEAEGEEVAAALALAPGEAEAVPDTTVNITEATTGGLRAVWSLLTSSAVRIWTPGKTLFQVQEVWVVWTHVPAVGTDTCPGKVGGTESRKKWTCPCPVEGDRLGVTILKLEGWIVTMMLTAPAAALAPGEAVAAALAEGDAIEADGEEVAAVLAEAEGLGVAIALADGDIVDASEAEGDEVAAAEADGDADAGIIWAIIEGIAGELEVVDGGTHIITEATTGTANGVWSLLTSSAETTCKPGVTLGQT